MTAGLLVVAFVIAVFVTIVTEAFAGSRPRPTIPEPPTNLANVRPKPYDWKAETDD